MEAESSSVPTPAVEINQTDRKRRKNVGPKEGRRDRRGTRGTRNTEDGAAGDTPADGEKKLRFPKRNCALLIGFCGTGCNGMQMYVEISFDDLTQFHFLPFKKVHDGCF